MGSFSFTASAEDGLAGAGYASFASLVLLLPLRQSEWL